MHFATRHAPRLTLDTTYLIPAKLSKPLTPRHQSPLRPMLSRLQFCMCPGCYSRCCCVAWHGSACCMRCTAATDVQRSPYPDRCCNWTALLYCMHTLCFHGTIRSSSSSWATHHVHLSHAGHHACSAVTAASAACLLIAWEAACCHMMLYYSSLATAMLSSFLLRIDTV
jgi:hypothetical protein